MDVRLSAEQVALRDAASQMMEKLAPSTVAALDDTERAAKLDAAVESSGWRELRAASDAGDGSPLASAVEVAIVAEELGRGLADTPLLGPTLAADLRRRAGVAAVAEPETVALGPGLARPAPVAGEALGEGSLAVDARAATSALVLVPAEGGWRVGEVPPPATAPSTPSADVPGRAGAARHGSQGGGRGGPDLTRPLAGWDPMPAPRALAGQTRVLDDDDVSGWHSLGLAVACADLVGVMRGALDLTCDYARTRRQYGVAIGSFQAVQHLLADAFVAMEGSRSTALHAAWAVDALPGSDALAAVSLAKAYCGRAARAVCEVAIQVHGGIGNTWECLAHVYLRRALLSIELFGDVGESLGRVLAAHGVHDVRGDDGLR